MYRIEYGNQILYLIFSFSCFNVFMQMYTNQESFSFSIYMQVDKFEY